MDPAAQFRLQLITRQRLEDLRRAGVTELLRTGRLRRRAPAPPPQSEVSVESPQPARPTPQEATVSPSSPTPDSPAPSRKRGVAKTPSLFDTPRKDQPKLNRTQRVEALALLQTRVAACTRCEELACTRTQTVFGTGNPEAQLVFLGEAPGADEDRLGEPFVGRAGQLLTKIIEACTWKREQVYILNILKCRPPGNRNPTPAEAANCREYLMRQLEIIQPRYICCLGAVAAQNLLETTESIGRLRGRFHDFQGIKVLATYHPAYLLRNPSAKRHTWDDMKMLMRDMGVDIP